MVLKYRSSHEPRPSAVGRDWLGLLGQVLHRLNHDDATEDQLCEVSGWIQELLGADAVAIRLFNGSDYPYVVALGLEPGFEEHENLICEAGAPQCMCGQVLSQSTDPSKGYFTAGGSFFSGDIRDVAKELAAHRAVTVRAACLRAGLRTLALVPIRVSGDALGLLQIGHRDRNQLSLRDIEQLERLCESIALALARRYSDAALARTRTSSRRLRRALERFFHQSGAFLCIATIEGTIQRINPALVELVGCDPETLDETTVDQLLHPEDRELARHALGRLTRGETINALRCRIIDREGAVRTLESSASSDSEEGLVYISAIDVSDRISLEEQLRQRDSMEAIGQLTAGVAHDFNNQLLGILGYAELLELRVADPDARRYASSIRGAARHASELTDQLLAYARHGPYELETVAVHPLIEEATALLRRSIDRRIRIDLELGADPDSVNADRKQLRNGILNLMLNARDAMPDGGVLTVATRNRSIVESETAVLSQPIVPGDYLEVTVSDTGVGMSPEACKRVFEPFYTSKPFGDGSGLGLAALHGTVTQLGGSVGVASEIGEGSTFTVLLPTAVPEVSQPEPAGSDRPLDVLVVDDEEIVRDIAREMLVMLGHRPLLAASGPEALQQLQGDPAAFDLVLLDLVMPEMSGADVFRRLREIAPQLPVVICSGYSHNEQVGSLIDEGALGFLHKPFDSHDLEVAIDKALSPEGPRDRRSG